MLYKPGELSHKYASYGAIWPRFAFQWHGTIHFVSTFRPAEGTTQPPILGEQRDVFSMGIKQLKSETENSPLSSSEFKNLLSFSTTTTHVFMVWSHGKGDKFTFFFTPCKPLRLQDLRSSTAVHIHCRIFWVQHHVKTVKISNSFIGTCCFVLL